MSYLRKRNNVINNYTYTIIIQINLKHFNHLYKHILLIYNMYIFIKNNNHNVKYYL